MSYLAFISDEHLLNCIDELYKTYLNCQQSVELKKFYENKVDHIKFNFDMQFNEIDIQDYVKAEITRKHDKTINNAIGLFHQNLFNGIDGYEAPPLSGYDIRKTDNTIFAELKNKHNTMNSSSTEATFLKLKKWADKYPNSTCYLVEIIATQSQDILWTPKCICY
ncbi:Eco47II family restriction endonuclease [Clostridium felsineum]|uniref:Uncharacterized protein n=1 Tax=Clostridium felsineum TaxID=36839 RepID=A0A1S8M9Z7_9CLOT|nr:Eco47II family restriction endonuclease [Clostridium felsineum]URZ08644.1 hypothetical protein CLROS_040260 [Clostridium felsineum]URZ13674.1 hypothetical protein CROST_044400 [Clostridium felsineum]